MPTGAVTTTKAWIEMLHRYLATGVGVLILTLTAFSWWTRYTAKKQASQKVRNISTFIPQAHLQISPWWPTASLIWVCVVGAFGALTVTLKLFPAIVTLHLLGALVLLTLLTRQAAHYDAVTREVSDMSRSGTANNANDDKLSKHLRTTVTLTFALVWLQIALGGWVSTNYAVLACNTFPACQNSFWPDMNFNQGFTLWRELGLTSSGENISFSALTAIHYTHRLSAYVLFIAMGYSAWLLARQTGLKRYSNWLIGLALWQFFTGVTNAVMGWPLLAALAHTAGAAALVVVLTWLLSRETSDSNLNFVIRHRHAPKP
jgi:cytochrome c oxidase assembly protein subunit 15